ncbi:MAG: DNA polymerase III subunit chi [Gammaproteobacteria bacterium]|nr:DNA polymerase III subunit chi [Gammaproteobacteria bacterium]
MSEFTVTFLSVPINSDLDLVRLICLLTGELTRGKQNVHILTENQDMSKQIDDTMWVYPDHRFIPHGVANHSIPNCLVTISSNRKTIPTTDALINLTSKILDERNSVASIYEIATREHIQLTAAREKFRTYQQQKIPIHHRHVDDWETSTLIQ